MLEDFPQLPHGAVKGIAYTNVMGGPDIQLCLEDDDLDEIREQYDEPEEVNVLSEAIYPMELMVRSSRLLRAARQFIAEYQRGPQWVSQDTFDMFSRLVGEIGHADE